MSRLPPVVHTRRHALGWAAAALVVVYLLGTVMILDPAWPIRRDLWWMWLIAIPFVGAYYADARRGLLTPDGRPPRDPSAALRTWSGAIRQPGLHGRNNRPDPRARD